MIKALGVVFRKELVDSLRDRRSIMAALIWPVTGPLIFALMFTFIAHRQSTEKPLALAVKGAEYAPTLIRWLGQQGVRVTPAPAEPETAVRDGDEDLVLEIPGDYAEDFKAGRTATLRLIIDESRDKARTPIRRTREYLRRYSAQMASLRLIARGVSPDLANPVAIEDTDLSTPQKVAARVLSMIPFFAMLAAFMGGMNVAIDTSAGERERGSLEALLINPVPRSSVVVGKWLVVAVFNLAVAALTLIAFRIAFAYVPLHELEVQIDLGPRPILLLVAILAPLATFSAALLMTVSLFARSFKEAQTYLSMIVFVPMLPAMMLMLNPVKPTLWMVAVPSLGQILLMNDVLGGLPVGAARLAVAVVSGLVATLIILVVATRLFHRERIIFGR